MRKLILKMSVSLDGFVCGPNREMDWFMKTRTPGGASWVEKTLQQAGIHIMGSRTFNNMISYWPTSTDPLAAPMNEIPKMVFSKKGKVEIPSVNVASWANALVATDLVSEIKKLKQQSGNYILAHGGADFAQNLVKHDLIDEYRLVVHPVALGQGLPLFSSTDQPIYLKLESSTPLEGGSIANIYSRP